MNLAAAADWNQRRQCRLGDVNREMETLSVYIFMHTHIRHPHPNRNDPVWTFLSKYESSVRGPKTPWKADDIRAGVRVYLEHLCQEARVWPKNDQQSARGASPGWIWDDFIMKINNDHNLH